MPSPLPGKCRGSVVRQLSLQGQVPVQSAGPRRGLKKQFSEDDSRVLTSVEITGQGWSGGSQKPESILRVGSADGKLGQSKVTGSRPKPVKVAWADRKPDSVDYPAGVEVVATKCQGQPRPLSVKTQRMRNPLLGDKDTLVYTRMQLAERLRSAWREREKTKPNLNIFLARGSDGNSTHSGPASDRIGSTSGDDHDNVSTMSETTIPLDKKRKSLRVRAFSQDFCHSESLLSDSYFKSKEELMLEPKEPSVKIEITESTPRNEDVPIRGHLQELNKIEIRVQKNDDLQRNLNQKSNKDSLEQSNNKNEIVEDSSKCVKLSEDKENVEICEKVDRTESCENQRQTEKKEVTAQDRRANFRRSSVLHKTITESFSSKSPREEDEEVVETAGDIKVITKPKKPPMVRAFSAPSQNDTTNPPKPIQSLPKPKVTPPRRLQPAVSFDMSNINGEDIAALRERIKSAPIRRKLKSAAARRKNKEKEELSEDEIEIKETTATTKKTTRRRHVSKNGGDIVTMVSLVSPAESDTEESVILPTESWTGEEKEEATETTNDLSKNSETSGDSSSFVIQKFVSLRKTTKTVSFLSQPPVNRNYSASFPSRRAPAGTPIIIPTPIVSNPALTPAQIQEREKRPPTFSAINSGTDGRGIKRRLIRSATEPPKEDDKIEENTKITAGSVILDEIPQNVRKNEENETEEKPSGEPEFKSPKEKECWTLYQKMSAKGVSVSFDTVLRGMLTPTEYRLRKNQLLSTC